VTTGTITTGSDSCGVYFRTKSWSGTDGKYSADGRPKLNPYTMTLRSTFKQSGAITPTGCGANCTNAGCWVTCRGSAIPSWNSNDDLILLGKLASNIRGHSFNAGTFIAQGHQLVAQSVSTISALYRSYRHLRRGDLSSALKLLGLTPGQRKSKDLQKKLSTGDVSGAWLAMQYGWLPFLSDVYESAKAFEVLTQPRQLKFTATRSKRVFNDPSASTPNYRCKGYNDRSIRYVYLIKENLSAYDSLALLDPLSVAWEVTPWSFVVDWFIPIGNYLEAKNVFSNVTGTWMKSDLTRFTAKGPVAKLGCQWRNCPNPGQDYIRTVSLTRTIGNTSLAVPLPSFERSGLHGKRILNAVALAHQKIR